jgi:hypothetical protein
MQSCRNKAYSPTSKIVYSVWILMHIDESVTQNMMPHEGKHGITTCSAEGFIVRMLTFGLVIK